MRLDAGFRADPSTATLTATYDGGSSTALELTAGLYLSLDALLDELAAKLATVTGTAAATHVAGVVTITWPSSHALVLTWSCPALRDWLGFAGGISSSTGSATGASPSPGVFVASLPWSEPRPVGWELTLLRARHPSGRSRSFRRGLRQLHAVTARVLHRELEQFRAVLRTLARGTPGTLYRDAGDVSPWAWDTPTGALAVQLVGDRYEDALADGRALLELELELSEYIA